jgi:hypothetical protein
MELTLGANLGKSHYSKKDRFFNPSYLIYNEEGAKIPASNLQCTAKTRRWNQ